MTVKLIGNATAASIDGWYGYAFFVKFSNGSAGTCSEIRVKASAGNVKVAIYNDNSGSPGTVRAAQNTAQTVVDGWNTIQLSSTTQLTANTPYWLAVAVDDSTSLCHADSQQQSAIQRYKAGWNLDNLTDNPSGLGEYSAYTLGIEAWGTTSAAVTVNAPCATSSGQAYAPGVTGAASVSSPCATSSGLAYAPLVGLVIDIQPPAAVSSGMAYAPAVSCGCTLSVPAATSSSQAYTVIAGPVTGVDVSASCAVSTSQAYTVSTTVRFHVILEASYEVESQEVNRAFVVGQDAAIGFDVSGNAIIQGEVDLVGERLEVQHDPSIGSASVAASVAAAVLARARLGGKKGAITIPPHCGLELWDMVNVTDTVANQSTDYRVSGYSFEYDAREAVYRHEIQLCDS